MQRWTTFALFFLMTAAMAAAVYYYRETLELRHRLAGFESADDTRAKVAEVEETGTPAQERSEPEEVAPVEEAPPTPQREARDNRFAGRRGRMVESMARVLSDPGARAATISRLKGNVDRTYGGLFVKLGLDEVQVETLRTLLAERQLAQMEGFFLSRTSEDSEGRASAQDWRQTKTAEIDSGVASILGPDGNQVLRDYMESAPQRATVAEISLRASYSGVTLDAVASDKLVQVLRSAETQYPVDTGASSRSWRGSDASPDVAITQEFVSSTLEQQQAQNQAVLNEARGFLDESQLAALADQQIEDYETLQQELDFMLRNPDVPRFMFRGGRSGAYGPPPPGGPGG